MRFEEFANELNEQLRVKNIMTGGEWPVFAKMMSQKINNMDDALKCFGNNESLTFYRGH